MPACGYEFYLLVFNSLRSLMRYRVEKLLGPKRSIKITDHFTCISANVIYCITCTLCRKVCISVTRRRLGDRFREYLRNVEKDDKNAWWTIVQKATYGRLTAFPCIKEALTAAKFYNKNLSFKSALLILTVSTNAFHSTNLFCCFSR